MLGDALPRRALLTRCGLVGTACLIAGLLLVCVVVNAILQPVIDGSLKRIIAPEQFPRAMGAAQARSSVLEMVGSPVSGWLFALAHPLPFVFQALCRASFLGGVSRIGTDLGQGEKPDSHGPKHWFAGYGYLRSRPELFRLLWCAPLINLAAYGTFSWVTYQLAHDGRSPAIIGLVTTGFAVGTLLGAALTPWLTDCIDPGYLVIVGLAYQLVFFAMMYAVPRTPWILALCAGLSMLLSPALNSALFGYVFAATPEGLQSRVIATFSVIAGMANVLAPIVASQTVAHSTPAVMGSIVCGLSAVAIAWVGSSRHVRGIERV